MTIKQINASDTWGLRQQVMWPEMDIEFVKLSNDANGTHFGLFIEQKLISVVSLFEIDKGEMQFRKLATKTSEQRKGYGSKLLTHLITYAKQQNVHILWCNARSNKLKFYQRFNFLPTNKTFVKQNVTFVVMQKVM